MTQNPKRPLWKAYEDQIHRVLLNQVAPGATVTFDDGGRQRLPGRFSLVNRQIDVLVRGHFAGLPEEQIMIVDCKCFDRNVDVTHVEAFAGLVDDVNVPLGLLVTSSGFTEAARHRAAHVRGTILRVVNIDDYEFLSRKQHLAFAHTTGAGQAIVSYFDGVETVIKSVDVDLAKRLLHNIDPTSAAAMFPDRPAD